METLDTFQITIERRSGNAWPVVAEYGRPGAFLPIRNECILRLDQVALDGTGIARDYGSFLVKRCFVMMCETPSCGAGRERRHLRVLLFVEADDLRTHGGNLMSTRTCKVGIHGRNHEEWRRSGLPGPARRSGRSRQGHESDSSAVLRAHQARERPASRSSPGCTAMGLESGAIPLPRPSPAR